MRSILEKALIALLNEEREKADALFHDFILERSRQIHESLRQGEDFVLDESWEAGLAMDEMFTESDLIGEEDDTAEDEQVNEFAGDDEVAGEDGEEVSADAEADADDMAADDAAEDSAIDAEGDVEGEDQDIETRVDDLEAELTRLAAEFDALVAGEDEVVDGVRGDLEGGEFGAEDGDDAFAGEDDFGGDDFGGDAEVEEEGFDPLGESALSDLEKVKVTMADGVEQGGKSFTQNKKSPALQPKLGDRALKGEPVEIKAKEHSGFEKETAPSVADQKIVKARNTKAKAADGRTKVSKEGDKSAELNDPLLSKENDKSLIGSTKVPMGKN
jgi:hypothetical protein